MNYKKEIADFLPLTEATFFILLSLSSKPKHGYAIMKEVQEMSDGRITFSTGTLYGAIKRLLDQGWITRNEEEEKTEPESTRTRKEYELTALGRKVMNSDVIRMKTMIHLAASIQTGEV